MFTSCLWSELSEFVISHVILFLTYSFTEGEGCQAGKRIKNGLKILQRKKQDTTEDCLAACNNLEGCEHFRSVSKNKVDILFHLADLKRPIENKNIFVHLAF